MPTESVKLKKLLRRADDLFGKASEWYNHYDDLARVMLSRREGFARTMIEGERRTENIFDGTPMQAARGLANAIGGLLRPEGLPEVDMKPDDDELTEVEEVKAWLADTKKKLKAAFNNPKARFRQASGESDQDIVVFGQAVKFVGESRTRDHLLFQTLHLKDVVVFYNEEGAPIGLFRKRKMPLHQMVDKWGVDKLSKASADLFKLKPDGKIDLMHAVVPRENPRANPLFAKDLPIADLWIEVDAKHELSEGGFHEFPFIVPRWDTTSGEDRGRSPGMIALPDADTLQAMGETILISGQRLADPPLAVPNDGTFDALNTFPGGVSYYDHEAAVAVRGNPFFTIDSGANLPIARDMQEDTRSQIWSAFFRNILNLPVDGPEMTATEVIQRKEEFVREIGPTFGRLETDDTAPTVERAFMIMLRAGGFLPIPPILQGRNIRFEYDSPVIRIRKQIESAAAKLWADERIELATTTGRTDILDVVNFDKLSRHSADALGIPKEIVNSQDVVDGIREQRQQQIEEQEQAQLAREAIEAGKTGSEIGKNIAEGQAVSQATEQAAA